MSLSLGSTVVTTTISQFEFFYFIRKVLRKEGIDASQAIMVPKNWTEKEAKQAIQEYMDFYNTRRPHQSLDYKVPKEIHFNRHSNNKI